VVGYVVVSYSRQDAAYVDRLVQRLEQAGIRTWRDIDHIRYGDRWEQVLQARVDDCAVLIVVMSPAAEASPHVGNELERARNRGKPIMPVLLAGEPFFALGAIHRFDGRGGRLPDDAFLNRLAELVSESGYAEPTAGAGARLASHGERVRPLLVGDPPASAVAWQDRSTLLQELVRVAGDGGTAVVCALAGQRGVGKTQLAAAYARLRIQHGWPVIVWADADTEAGAVSALDELAAAVGLRQPVTDPQEAARAALRWLRAHPGPCLLVFDNAVDADLIRAWTPSVGSVHTVVTTTRRELDSLGDLIDVTLFSHVEAIDYLQRRSRLQNPDAAAKLADKLGRLPLALAQAAAIIGPGRRYPTYRKYLQALDRTPTATLLPHTPGDPYPYGLAETILLSLDDLRLSDPRGRARHLLDLLAVLAPTGVDPGLLQHLMWSDRPDLDLDGLDTKEGPDVDSLVAVLAGRSLTLPTTGDSDRIVVHRLVQRVVRERCQHTGTLDAVITAAITAVEAAAQQVSPWHDRALLIEYALHAQTLLTHTVDDPNRGNGLALLGRFLRWLNDAHSYTTSIAIGAAVVVESERVLGPDHTHTLRSRNSLAFAYMAVGRLEEAIGLFTRTLADFERVLGREHPNTLISRNNLAATYEAIGWLDEAMDLHTRTLADRERLLGPDHPDTLISRNNLARTYQAVGQLDEAIDLHVRTLADRERVLGRDHPETLNSRNNLAGALEAVGRLDEAIELHARTLTDVARVRGPDHPDTLNSRNNLARAYQVVGRLDEAIDLHIRTLADRERILGQDHPDTLNSRNNLAGAYEAVGRLDEAIELHTRTLADRERLLGPDHPDTLNSRNNLAHAYQLVGRLDEAIALHIHNVAECERVLGPNHPGTLICRNNLARAYRAVSRTDEADALFDDQ
jgi:tetratricopeptide (TPR) repeat protein